MRIAGKPVSTVDSSHQISTFSEENHFFLVSRLTGADLCARFLAWCWIYGTWPRGDPE